MDMWGGSSIQAKLFFRFEKEFELLNTANNIKIKEKPWKDLSFKFSPPTPASYESSFSEKRLVSVLDVLSK